MIIIEDIMRSINIIKEMLIDRGDNIDNLNYIEKDELKSMLKVNNSLLIIDVNDKFRIIYIISKFKSGDIKKYLTEKDLEHVIIISQDKLTTTYLKIFDNVDYKDIDFEFFIIKELLFNISKHVLVPKHEIIKDQEEIKNIISKYGVKTKTQLNIIQKDDPMARYLHAKSGDIIKITRNSPTSGLLYVYRTCV